MMLPMILILIINDNISVASILIINWSRQQDLILNNLIIHGFIIDYNKYQEYIIVLFHHYF